MPVEGDIYQIVVSGTYLGQHTQNVYMYRIEDVPTATAAEGLATEWESDVFAYVNNILPAQHVTTTILVKNLFDPADIYEGVINVTGGLGCTGPAANVPSNLAQYARFIRDNARVDNGAKYFVGPCEANVSGNDIIGMDAAYTAAAAALIDTLVAAVTDTFRPVLVKRVRSVANKTNSFGQTVSYYRYRLPASQVEMDTNWAYVRQVQFSTLISHLDSRQPGHGA